MSAEQVRAEMQRIFGDRAITMELDPEMVVLRSGEVPEDVVAMVTCLEAEDYVKGSFRGWDHQLLYDAWSFEESNGEDGLIKGLVDDGGLPEGTYEIGEHLVVDTKGALPAGIAGAVYATGSDYCDFDKVADSVAQLLALIEA